MSPASDSESPTCQWPGPVADGPADSEPVKVKVVTVEYCHALSLRPP